MATQRYDDGPEVALQSYPEVVPQPPARTPSTAHTLATTVHSPPPTGGYAASETYPKAGENYVTATSALSPPAVPVYNAAGVAPNAQYQQFPPNAYDPISSRDAMLDEGKNGLAKRLRREGPCGCTLLVFILSVTIAVLAAAVIGLAAGTGVEANRANQVAASVAALQANISSGQPTSFNAIDNNCSNSPDTVTGTRYTSFPLLGQVTFTMHCNKDTTGNPLLSLFVADFNTCMDACSGYSKYLPGTFGKSNKNTTCGAVSFIPLWTSKTNASTGGAPGNCYLKPLQNNSAQLPTPNIGTECHAAVLNSD